MSSRTLPFEVLQDIFRYIGDSKRDLAQIQLVCHDWNYAAREFFYKTVTIYDDIREVIFIATISGPLNLGSLVKEVYFETLCYPLPRASHQHVWEQRDTFRNVINNCPQILKIGKYAVMPSVYTELLNAASNNQLQHLQVLPEPLYGVDQRMYASTALSFKNTLNKLVLFYCSSELTSTESYHLLTSKLKEFKALKKLKIDIESNQCIINLDPLFQDCPSLISLNITIHLLYQTRAKFKKVSTTAEETSLIPSLSIIPRPSITTFKGEWDIIQTDSSLLYFMHKFPNLKRLEFHSSDYFCEQSKSGWLRLRLLNHHSAYLFSEPTLVRFFQYLSKIPCLYIKLSFRVDITSCWSHFIKDTSTISNMATSSAAVIFIYHPPNEDIFINNQNIGLSRSSFRDPLKITIHFHFEDDDRSNRHNLYSPHKRMVEKSGGLIRKLEVRHIGIAHFRNESIFDDDTADDNSDIESERLFNSTVDAYWLDEILQNCHQLEELTVIEPGFIKLQLEHDIKSTNSSIKTLRMINWAPSTSYHLLYELSDRLPSLQDFYSKYSLGYSEGKNIIINMPFTSFTSLAWDEGTYQLGTRKKEWKLFTRLTTIMGQVFLELHESGTILVSSEEIYKRSLKDASNRSFDIICKGILVFSVSISGFKQSFKLSEIPVIPF
ncbi:hypothetical protein BD770DRAFT_378702 [Pilaira anomala]|nr:hypothetical protein BD770DRAFT_378702 [Pilaira anomala]